MKRRPAQVQTVVGVKFGAMVEKRVLLRMSSMTRTLAIATVLCACRCASSPNTTRVNSGGAGGLVSNAGSSSETEGGSTKGGVSAAGSGGSSKGGSNAAGGGTSSKGGSSAAGGGAGGEPHAGAAGKPAGGSGTGGATANGGAPAGGSAGKGNSAGNAGTGGGGSAGAPSGGQGGKGPTPTYSTTFSVDENPLRDGGAWAKQGGSDGLNWNDVVTSGGFAYGPKGGIGGATDSVACLWGFPPNQWGSAVIHKAAGTTNYFEVELLLRWQISAHGARGYEINLSHDGAYSQVVRWNGAQESFDFVVGNFSNQSAPADGDVFYAQIVGNIITVRLNDKVLGTADVSSIGGTVWYDGNPGIGFFRGEPALSNLNANLYGFTSYSAGAL